MEYLERHVIKFCVKLSDMTIEIYNKLQKVFGSDCMSHAPQVLAMA